MSNTTFNNSTRSLVLYNNLVKPCMYIFCNSMYENIELQKKDNNTPLFSLNGKTFTAKVVDVYDGDTITVVFKVFNQYYKWNCRIMHVDTPEIKTKNKIEKERGIFVRNKLKDLLLNKIINIYCSDKNEDKYGRLLIEFNVPDTKIKIHDWLINNNYAKPYEGNTKQKWNTETWYKYSENNYLEQDP